VFARSDSLLGCMAEIVGCELLSSNLCLVHKGALTMHFTCFASLENVFRSRSYHASESEFEVAVYTNF
jgi:hypothetical protein